MPPEKTRLEKTPPDRAVPESRRFETPRARSVTSATSPTAESSEGLHDAPPQTRLDADHRLAQPHIDVRASIEESQDGRSNMWTGIGQLLAYAGVLGLTLGSCLVLWSYFGGPARYAPTGWLITTASQMLLFLGVITLISGGLEQTTRILTRRIDRLGERLLRFEQASRAPVGHGPRISPAAYQGADQATEFHRSDDNARAAASNQHA
ncbi:MAG: hypothetical protein GXP27_18340 [Planctomycetes bacterium]|nr:hypothetical protein [Planctomycetota bacterium]